MLPALAILLFLVLTFVLTHLIALLVRTVEHSETDDQGEKFRCDVCRYETFYLACKYVCPNCGAKRDCSDP